MRRRTSTATSAKRAVRPTSPPISLNPIASSAKTPVLRTSKHLYVELSKSEDFLREYIATPGVLQEDMRNFVTSWINGGLREWCVSRDAPYFGFKIPGTENKYFYVWLDAPIGYISSTEKWCKDNGRRVEDFWSPQSGAKVVHFIGKDIVQFHLLFWPVMLKNSNFNLPSTVFVHGYLNTCGEKMSKSRGTSISAKDFLQPSNIRRRPSTCVFSLHRNSRRPRWTSTSAGGVREPRQYHACEQHRQPAPPDVYLLRAVFRQKNP
jgi:methionyl-tRNA synthetase